MPALFAAAPTLNQHLRNLRLVYLKKPAISIMFTAIAGNGAIVTAKLQLSKEIRRTLASALCD
jgi:hypothetical protein